MIDLNPIREDLRLQAATAWPEVLAENAGGVMYAEYADTLAWADIARPYAVIITDTIPRGTWAADALSYEVPFDIYYVAHCEDEGESILDKLGALEALLWPGGQDTDPLANGQVLDVLGLSVSNALPPNLQFQPSGHPVRAGMLRVKILIEDPR